MARMKHVYLNMVKENDGNEFYLGEVYKTARAAQIAKAAYKREGWDIETCCFIGPIEESKRETITF